MSWRSRSRALDDGSGMKRRERGKVSRVLRNKMARDRVVELNRRSLWKLEERARGVGKLVRYD